MKKNIYNVFINIHFSSIEISSTCMTSFVSWNIFYIKGSAFPFAKSKSRKCLSIWLFNEDGCALHFKI